MTAVELLKEIANSKVEQDPELIFKQRYDFEFRAADWIKDNADNINQDSKSPDRVLIEISNMYHELSQRPVKYQRDKMIWLCKDWLKTYEII